MSSFGDTVLIVDWCSCCHHSSPLEEQMCKFWQLLGNQIVNFCLIYIQSLQFYFFSSMMLIFVVLFFIRLFVRKGYFTGIVCITDPFVLWWTDVKTKATEKSSGIPRRWLGGLEPLPLAYGLRNKRARMRQNMVFSTKKIRKNFWGHPPSQSLPSVGRGYPRPTPHPLGACRTSTLPF